MGRRREHKFAAILRKLPSKKQPKGMKQDLTGRLTFIWEDARHGRLRFTHPSAPLLIR